MTEKPCSNCDLGLRRKDCNENDFNICMARLYMSKINKFSAYTIVDDILINSLDIGKFKEVATEMVRRLE